MAAALWLYQLHGRIQEQSDTLKALAHSVEADRQQPASGHGYICSTRPGSTNPTEFDDRYNRVTKARDDARLQLKAQQSINETLGVRTKELEATATKLATDLDDAKKTASQYETDAREATELRDKVADLEKMRVKLKRELEEKTEIAEAGDSQKGADIVRRLNLFRTATYILGALSAALAAAVGYFTLRIFGEPTPAPQPLKSSSRTRLRDVRGPSRRPSKFLQIYRVEEDFLSMDRKRLRPGFLLLLALAISLAGARTAWAQLVPRRLHASRTEHRTRGPCFHGNRKSGGRAPAGRGTHS